MRITVASFHTLAFPYALASAGTQAGPTGEMLCMRELSHVETEFCNQGGDCRPVNTRYCAEPVDNFHVWPQLRFDHLLQAGYLVFEIGQIIHQFSQQELMVSGEASTQ